MQQNLSFEQAPPFSVPSRFFLTAPLFGVAAGLLILYVGPDIFASRWTPAALALTHLLTLGFINLVMCGALMQMLPVLAGAALPYPVAIGTGIHVLLTAGAVALAAGFLLPSPVSLRVATALLVVGYGVFVVAVAYALTHAKAASETVTAIRFSVTSLFITVGLGATLALELVSGTTGINTVSLTNIHLVRGILGWIGLLVCGVAYQVVPMFQMTPRYPKWMLLYLTPLLFIGLIVWSGLFFAAGVDESNIAARWLPLCLSGYALFAIVTLRLQVRRKRSTEDVTKDFWTLGMLSVLAAVVVHTARPYTADIGGADAFLLGTLLLVGFAVSVINGMLYKIVPFLVWFHLQHRIIALNRASDITVPNVKRVIPTISMRKHFRLHVAAFGLTVVAVLWPKWLVYPAGLLLAASFLLLWRNLQRGVAVYVRYGRLLGDTRGVAKVRGGRDEM